MKKISKVLSVVLALMLLVGCLAVNVSAADWPLKITLTADKEYVKAGDTVTVVMNLKSNSTYPAWSSGAICLGYNSAQIVAPTKTDVIISGYAWADTISEPSITWGPATMGSAISADETANYGWDSIGAFTMPDKSASVAATDFTTAKDAVAFQFKIASGVTDGDKIYIGVPADALSDLTGDLYFTERTVYNQQLLGNTDPDFNPMDVYDCTDALVTLTVGEPSVADPAYLKTQCQWADGNTAGNLNVGISATFSTANYPIAFNEAGTSTNVTAVGVDVTSGAYTTTQETQFVYEVDATTYRYRAVITGVPHDASGELTVQFYIVINGEKKLGEIKTINLGDVIAASHSNGLPAYTGA